MFATTYLNQALAFIRESLTYAGLSVVPNQVSFKAYPTVTSGQVNIAVDHPGNLMIFNTMGVLVVNESLTVGIHIQDLADQDAGFYWVNYITDSGERVQSKIIIK